tara:strand:+ start:4820 stop:5167 length:348 start_codon:yes stop_codon:yes gene_type:complete
MNRNKINTYIISPACKEVVNKGYTSFDDYPVWALLEQVEALLLNGDTYPAVDMIESVRERLTNLTTEDTAQWNPVMTSEDWESYLEWQEEQKNDARLARQIADEEARETEDLIQS